MGSHGRCRIKEGGSVLDAHPIHRIGVVTAPDLGSIIQHACIKSSAASAASLYQHIRVSLYQLVQKFIYAQHIIIGDLPLSLCHFHRIKICKASVHIPLDIFDISLIEHSADLLEDMISHLFPGKIKHQLVSAPYRPSSRNLNCIIRVGSI